MEHLDLSPGLKVPLSAVTETFAILAKRGAGKSTVAVGMAEEFYKNGAPFVAVDPKGDWWGIRSSADGKGAGLPIPVFGGLHGDVPLEPTGGKVIADLIVDKRLTSVLDVSEFSKGEQIRFLTDFADRLYRRNTEPLHVFLEEADEYIPQQVFSEMARLVYLFGKIVKLGRTRGLGITAVTQRSAGINKNILTQIETLIVMRTTAPQDRDAIMAWVKEHEVGKEAVGTLSKLDNGEAWVWSPHFLKTMKRVVFRRRQTFDSGATPELGKMRAPATLADIDLKEISAAMAATIEKARADDPKELRKMIADLERRVQDAVGIPDAKVMAQERARGQQAGYVEAMRNVADVAHKLRGVVSEIDALVALELPVKADTQPSIATITRDAPRKITTMPVIPKTVRVSGSKTNGALHPAAEKMLAALQRNYPSRYTWEQVACLAGIVPGNGHYYHGIKSLRESGNVIVFDDGVSAHGEHESLARIRPVDVVDTWSRKLTPPATDMLAVIFERRTVSTNELAAAIAKKPGNGYWYRGVKALRDAGLIVQEGNTFKVSEILR